MKDQSGLQELVVEYRRSGRGKDAIMERIAAQIYADPCRFGFDGEDEAAEALLHYGHRIAALPDRFVDRGLPFEAYLATSLRFLSRTVRRNGRREAERRLVCERALAECPTGEDQGGPDPPSPTALRAAGKMGAGKGKRALAFASRLVFLYLKCAWDADDASTRRVAEAAGVDLAWLSSATAQARRSLEDERARCERMTASRNRSWCRIRVLEARLMEETDLPRRIRLQASLERERSHFERAREELRLFRPVVPNSVVARILDVPKGTVDSGLYYLKKGRVL
ncbi:MAG TPA: hypothetical protein VFL04_08110 [Rectinemataceae bacterium]|nr:hypothetical protein [Rectinemataceae bacterium]